MACPKNIIELRKQGPNRVAFVSCVNQDKGAPARRACEVACIGCGKCVKLVRLKPLHGENPSLLMTISVGCVVNVFRYVLQVRYGS